MPILPIPPPREIGFLRKCYLLVHLLLIALSPYKKHSQVEATGNNVNSAETEVSFKLGGGTLTEHYARLRPPFLRHCVTTTPQIRFLL